MSMAIPLRGDNMSNTEAINKNFETSDFSLAIYLRVNKIPIKSYPVTYQTDRVQVGFVVEKTTEVDRLIAEFYANGLIPIQDYLRTAKEIKDVMMKFVRSSKYTHPVPAGMATRQR